MKKLLMVFAISIFGSMSFSQTTASGTFDEFISYIHSCPNLKTQRLYQDTARAEAEQTGLSTTQSFLPKLRYGKYERDSLNEYDLVNVMQVSGSIPLNEVVYGYKISELESKVENLNANIKIYDGISLLINSFFKWRSLYLMRSEISSINKYFERTKFTTKGKLSFADLSKRTDAILIRSRLTSYETQISYYEKLFSGCSKSSNLKNPWDIPIDPQKVSSELWNKSIDQQSHLRKTIEKSYCRSKSQLIGLKLDKESSLWYPKFFYAWAQETGSKLFPDRSGWSLGFEVSIPWYEGKKPTLATDDCYLSLQEDEIKDASKTDSIKKQVEELSELILLRNRWGEVMKEALGAFKLQGEGPKLMSSAITQFERLNLEVSEIETNLVMASTFKESK
jgi:hypothetical protein